MPQALSMPQALTGVVLGQVLLHHGAHAAQRDDFVVALRLGAGDHEVGPEQRAELRRAHRPVLRRHCRQHLRFRALGARRAWACVHSEGPPPARETTAVCVVGR